MNRRYIIPTNKDVLNILLETTSKIRQVIDKNVTVEITIINDEAFEVGSTQLANRIIEIVSSVTLISSENILSNRRFEANVLARSIAAKLLHEYAMLSPKEIGKILSKDRTTIANTLQVFDQMYNTNATYKEQYEQAKDLLLKHF